MSAIMTMARTAAFRSANNAKALSRPQSRAFHIENKVYENMPFSYRNKRAFAFKITAYLGTGFALPFFAVWFSQRKAASS